MKTTQLLNLTLLSFLVVLTFSCSDDDSGTSVLKDIDGNSYITVKIGSQTWMAENLKTTRYSTGDGIPQVQDEAAWAALADDNEAKAYCYFNNNKSNAYGVLYTFAAATNGSIQRDAALVQGVCPTGWHVPSDKEWVQLIEYVEGFEEYIGAGSKALKATFGWKDEGNGTDHFGFTALAGGERITGPFTNDSVASGWWTSSQVLEFETIAWKYRMVDDSESIDRGAGSEKSQGAYVRCVKD